MSALFFALLYKFCNIYQWNVIKSFVPQVHQNYGFEQDGEEVAPQLPRYNELPPGDVAAPQHRYRPPGMSPDYKNPPMSAPRSGGGNPHAGLVQSAFHNNTSPSAPDGVLLPSYSSATLNASMVSGNADLGSGLNQSIVSADASGTHQGARPKNSPPGRSAFTPVAGKGSSGGNGDGGGKRKANGSDTTTPVSHNGSALNTSRQYADDAGGSGSSFTTDDSPMTSAGGYAPHPLQYATYDDGLNKMGDSAEHERRMSTPQSTRSERHAPTATHDYPMEQRGAYTDAPKEPMRNGHGPQGYGGGGGGQGSKRNAYEPKRLDFNNSQTAVGNGPYVSQQDTVI